LTVYTSFVIIVIIKGRYNMKNLVCSLIVCVSVFILPGCQNKGPAGPQAPVNTATVTVTATDTPTVTITSSITQTHTITPTFTITNTPAIEIQAFMNGDEAAGTGQYNIYVSSDSTPVANATVTMLDLDSVDPAVEVPYLQDSGGFGQYLVNVPVKPASPHTMRCSVQIGASPMTAELMIPGAINIFTDGLYANWLYSGNQDTYIRIFDYLGSQIYLATEIPASFNHTVSPDPYTAGQVYTFRVESYNILNESAGAFSGTLAGSIFMIISQKELAITK
jgi:hypothetical protein